VEKYMRNTN